MSKNKFRDPYFIFRVLCYINPISIIDKCNDTVIANSNVNIRHW